jgi:L-aminopeptidase/D-esterase-like protein
MDRKADDGDGLGLPAGVTVGHWSDNRGRTGCTVVLVPNGAVAGVDVRGGAPGTLGTDGFRPGTLIEQAHAIVLTGGSVYGLEAAAGVMQFLEERGVGLQIGPFKVPAVGGAVIFDLLVGDPRARPNRDNGFAACQSATGTPQMGAVGAGTGATVAKAGRGDETLPGGVGIASMTAGNAIVAAVMVANSLGGIWDDQRHEWIAPLTRWDRGDGLVPGANTTIGVVVTDARLTKDQANRVATIAHDGVARAVRPAHTMYDGDTMFCLATGAKPASADAVEVAASEIVARAIAAGVRAARR